MSKKYKGKTCVYCSKPNSSQTADHVIARNFFLINKRRDLPQVPACKSCNAEKSKLEHYLTAVLPFGGQHEDASQNLNSMVKPRISKNEKLAKALYQGQQLVLVSRNGSPWTVEMTLPFDGIKADQLFRLITKGLAYWAWGIDLPDEECIVVASFLISRGEKMFQQLFAMNAKARVHGNLGDGTFIYEGAQAVDDPRFTVWRMSIYGATVGGAPAERCRIVYAITAPRRMPAAIALARWIENT